MIWHQIAWKIPWITKKEAVISTASLVRLAGFEPTTFWFVVNLSTLKKPTYLLHFLNFFSTKRRFDYRLTTWFLSFFPCTSNLVKKPWNTMQQKFMLMMLFFHEFSVIINRVNDAIMHEQNFRFPLRWVAHRSNHLVCHIHIVEDNSNNIAINCTGKLSSSVSTIMNTSHRATTAGGEKGCFSVLGFSL